MGPFVKSNNKTTKMMMNLLISLLPIIIFSYIKNGVIPYQKGYINFTEMFYPLIFILISTLSTFIFEIIYKIIFQKARTITEIFGNSYSIFPGLFLGLIVPLNTPIKVLVIGSFIASILGKMVFGGFGKNILNPALVGGLFIIIIYKVVLGGSGYLNKYEIDVISSGTPLSNAKAVTNLGNYETLVKPYGGLSNFLIGNIPGAVGETSSILCLLALVYLTITKTIKWKIPVTYLTTVFAMTYVIGGTSDLGLWYPLFQIFSGGLMFGAVFMATDPVTTPVTPIGQILYGLFLGVLTVTFRYLTPFPEGVLLSILVMNIFTRLLDKIGALARFKFKITLIPFLIAWILILALSLGISLKYKNKTDSTFEIISKETNGLKTEYVVTEKGYSGPIKASIVIEDGNITKLEILEQNDSFYQKVENTDYLNKLKQDIDCDTVSGATITSSAIKKMVQNTIEDYKAKTKDKKGNTEPVKKSTFEVISKTKIDDITTEYIVTDKGFSGKIKLQITIIDNVITNIVVLEQNDSYFSLVEEQDYINTIINNQNNLEELDTVSGATFSSKGIKNAVINTLKDYQN